MSDETILAMSDGLAKAREKIDDLQARLTRLRRAFVRVFDYVVEQKTRRVGFEDALPEIVELTGLDEPTARAIAASLEYCEPAPAPEHRP